MRLVLVVAVCTLCLVVRKPVIGDTKLEYLEHPSGIKLLMAEEQTSTCKAAFLFGIGFLKDPRQLKGLTYVVTQLLLTAKSRDYPNSKFDANSHVITDVKADRLKLILKTSCTKLEQDFKLFSSVLDCPVFDKGDLARILRKMEEDQHPLKGKAFYTFDDVQRMFSNPQTTFNYRKEGSISDLKVPNLIEHINKFYKEHFKLSRLAVTMYGSSVSTLRDIFSQTFRHVQPDETPPTRYNSEQFFTDSQLGNVFYLKSRYYQNEVNISIVFREREHALPTNPLNFIEYLVNAKHRGSLVNLLESKGWALNLHVLSKSIIESYSEVRVAIALSDAGFTNKEQVISVFFDYFKFIARNWKSYVYDNYRQYQEKKFMFYNGLYVSYRIAQICDNIIDFGPERAFSGNFDAGPDPGNEILKILRHVSSHNAFVTVHSQKVETEFVDRVTGMKFSAKRISSFKFFASANFELPPEQKYKINLDKLERTALKVRKSNPEVEPQAVDITPKELRDISSLYYMPGMSLGLPFCGITVNILLDKGHTDELLGHFAAFVINEALETKANQINKRFHSVDLTVSGSTTKTGIKFFLEGAASNMRDNTDILIQFMEEFLHFTIDGAKLDRIKRAYAQILTPFMNHLIYPETRCGLDLMTDAPNQFSEEKLSAMRAVTAEQIAAYIRGLLTDFYPQVIVSGNLSKRGARKILSKIKESFPSSFKQVQVPRYSFYSVEQPYTLLGDSLYRAFLKPEVYDAYYLGADVKALVFKITFTCYADKFLRMMKEVSRVNGAMLPYSPDFYEHQIFALGLAFPSHSLSSALKEIRETITIVLDELSHISEEEFRRFKQEAKRDYPVSFNRIKTQHNYLLKRMAMGNSVLSSNWEVVKAIDAMGLEEFRAMAVDKFGTNLRRSTVIVTRTQDMNSMKETLEGILPSNEKLYIGHQELQQACQTYSYASTSNPSKKTKVKL